MLAQASGGSKARSRRVLVVEDNVDSARSLAMLLRALGHEVELALDGEQALQALSRTRPEFVFLDLRLPGVDGFQICERIKRDPALRSARVIALTGCSIEECREKALAAGFDSFVAKPAGMEFFEDVLR